MRKNLIILTIITVSFLYPTISLAEIIAKETPSGSNTMVTFYNNSIEIATEIWHNWQLLSHEGDIPDMIINRYNMANQLVGKTEYKNNQPEGIHIAYNTKGNLILQGYFHNNIFTPEIYRMYYENGNLRIEENYKNAKLEGQVKEYYENGNIKSEKYYKESKLEGVVKEYFENNTLKSELLYKNNVLEGISKIYNEDGILIEESTYSSNKLNGPQTLYYNNAKIHYKRLYYINNLVREELFYKDGALKSSKYYPEFEPHDKKLYYDPDDEDPTFKRSKIFN